MADTKMFIRHDETHYSVVRPNGKTLSDCGYLVAEPSETVVCKAYRHNDAVLFASAEELLAMLKWAANGGCTWNVASHQADALNLIAKIEEESK